MGNRRNIILTTLSTLNYPNMNYYYMYQGEKQIYCNGVSAQEPGTKYFLTKYPIDEIVVVGSDETMKEGDIREVPNLLEGWERKNPMHQGQKMSAYEFYKYRIGSFLNEVEEEKRELLELEAFIPDMDKTIPPSRREELRGMLETLIQQKRTEKTPLTLSNVWYMADAKFWKDLKMDIDNSIKEEYKNSDEYRAYVGEETIQNCQSEEQELRKEIIRLKYENTIQKQKRQKNEYDYLWCYAFLCMSQDRFMKPLESNRKSAKGIKMIFVEQETKIPVLNSMQDSDGATGNGEIKYDYVDNINKIVNALYGEGKEEIHLYIDVQGGNRSAGYVRNAVLSILNNQQAEKVYIEEIVGTKYIPGAPKNEIADESDRYRINDLVSGMNAFIRYGKADMIKKYCQSMPGSKGTPVETLVGYMEAIDYAISICNMTELVKSIQDLRKFFKEEQVIGKSQIENIFDILRDGIKKDYGRLLDDSLGDEIDYLDLIEWCNRKGFIQQTLTLIEDKMPKMYFDKGVLKYVFGSKERNIQNGQETNQNPNKIKNDFIKWVGPSYERRIENIIFYNYQFQLKNKIYAWKNDIFEMTYLLKNGNLEECEQKNYQRGVYIADSKAYVKGILDEKNVFVPSDRSEFAEWLKQELTDDEFVKGYYRFHKIKKFYEMGNVGQQNTAEYKILDVNALYHILAEYVGYETLIGCLGWKEYWYENKYNHKKFEIAIKLSVHPELNHDVYLRKIERLFLLHEALKQERNSSNHASEKGIRFPYQTVLRAINIYVKEASEIFRKCNE